MFTTDLSGSIKIVDEQGYIRVLINLQKINVSIFAKVLVVMR